MRSIKCHSSFNLVFNLLGSVGSESRMAGTETPDSGAQPPAASTLSTVDSRQSWFRVMSTDPNTSRRVDDKTASLP